MSVRSIARLFLIAFPGRWQVETSLLPYARFCPFLYSQAAAEYWGSFWMTSAAISWEAAREAGIRIRHLETEKLL